MKKIDILGKRNQDKMKQMADPEAVIERKAPKHKSIGIPDELYTPDQSLVLSILESVVGTSESATTASATTASATTASATTASATTASATTAPTLKHILREIDTKRKAYIYQDKNHEIYDPRYSITTERIVELLVGAELLCHYCREICQVAYKESMCRRQWTLDRIDNNYGHNDANVVIACLDCNLKRGTMDAERFRQGKQFTFRKVE
jgi:hypothetical protein